MVQRQCIKNTSLLKANFTIKVLLYFLLIFSFRVTISQNLIPNPSFERANPDPKETLKSANNFTCEEWEQLNSRPEYLTNNRKGLNEIYSTTGSFGNQTPKHGEAYVALYFWFGKERKYSQYIQVKLIKPLVKDNLYCLSFHVNMRDKSSYAINEFNYLFVKEMMKENSSDSTKSNLNYTGIISSKTYSRIVLDSFFIDNINWMQLNSVYKAKGGESYLILGVFNEYADWKDLYDKYTARKIEGASYLIDSVSLIKIIDEKTCDCNFKTLPPPVYKPIILKNINFNQNETILLPGSFKELDSLSNYLKQNPKLRIEISGHTDNSGIEADNIKLSNERSKAVANYIIKKGIHYNRITYKGYGSSKPLKSNDTSKNKFLNRRVEFIIIN